MNQPKEHKHPSAKVPKGNPYHSATSGEMAIYRANSLILKKAGVQVEEPVQQVFNGQEVEVGIAHPLILFLHLQNMYMLRKMNWI
ncbi:hypothetical protein F3Y22_tig00110816pilonHSYRG00005 [Hibiscus syriacus]|uniref:Uncharacterized protein n=1 Tax=Hibiscus syriacus TaxID=106335 RepID=A0A6A2ZNM9_HIBSY|nr:UDP-sugar pyrophosphorylase-like [Hibiscus syriacus]KAE8693156.1 hypothetical protein F3Y22_tig00110816pilonHSYRG00005 [Hibiscus syriacus]